MHKKGQIIGIDLIISVIVFVLLLSFVFTAIWKYQEKIGTALERQEMNLKGAQISDLLVKSRGDPENWENAIDKLDTIGLVGSDRKLSDEKILGFIGLSNNTIKEKFNIEDFNFYFTIKSLDGRITQIENKSVKAGLEPSLNSTNSITTRRIALSGNVEKIIEFTLWK